jgi:hypothetical protein
MTSGCTQLNAVNYNPAAQIWDYSCIYIYKIWDKDSESFKCIAFKDVPADQLEDKSFTMSYSLEGQNWVFFHDYIPNFYFHTRDHLLNLKRQEFYRHNEKDTYGKYHVSTDDITLERKSFFIDVVFKNDTEFLLETINWISSVLENRTDTHDKGSEWNTLTHISAWNSQQHTGRIALSSVFTDLQYKTSRSTNGEWSLNDFRNIVTQRGSQFILDLFNNYNVDPTMVTTKEWYDAEVLQDKFVVVRFEFDNSTQKQVILHDLSVQGQKTVR